MLDELARRLLRAGLRRARRPCLDAGRGLGGGPLHGCRQSHPGEEATALCALAACGLAPRAATSAPASKASGCGRSARSWPRRARRLPAASARRCIAAARPGARPGRGSDLAAPAGRAACRPSGISPSRSRMIEDIERWCCMLAATLKQRSRTPRRGRAPLAACAVPGRRRGQPHRRRHIAADARAGADRQAVPRTAGRARRRHRRRLWFRPGPARRAFGRALRRRAGRSRRRDRSTPSEDLALFADRVRARLGDNAVLAPVMRREPSPERAVVAGALRRDSR